MNDYIKRLLNQKNKKLNNPHLQFVKLPGADEQPIRQDVQKVLDVLRLRGIDVSHGIESLRLYPEYKDAILDVYFECFAKVDDETKKVLGLEIVNQQPTKQHLARLEELFADIKGASKLAKDLRWMLIQPIARNLSPSYDHYRHYVEDFPPSNYRVHISECLYRVKDEPSKAYDLAVALLDAKEDGLQDFATVGGALTSLQKMGLKKADRAKVEVLLDSDAPIVKKLAKRLLQSTSK